MSSQNSSHPNLEQANKLGEDLSVNAPSMETNQVTHPEVVKAADTKNLTAPAVLPFDTLGQYAVDQVAAERKFLVALALLVVFSVVGFAAYSIPYALQWPKVSADTEPKPSPVPLETSPRLGLEPTLEQASLSSEEKDIVQQIEDPRIKKIPSNSLNNKLKIESKSNQQLKTKPLTEIPSGKIPSKSKDQVKAENKEVKKLSNKATKESTPNTKANTEVTKASNSNNANNQASISTKEIPNKDTRVATDRTVRPTVNEPVQSRSQTWDNPIVGEMKAPKRQSAKVIAKVVNRSRLQTPNGYVYQFDLIVRELNGVSVKWGYTSAHKSSYSGNNSVVSGLLGRELDANGSIHFRMAVRMTGRCIDDWYGEIVYDCSGVDENGNSVELHQVLALDNNFPTY
ncbi:MAG: hypothetical protein FD167_3790 [bacterium]|nr:MAG: hypothetical protein FD167_3790 [bacterium]